MAQRVECLGPISRKPQDLPQSLVKDLGEVRSAKIKQRGIVGGLRDKATEGPEIKPVGTISQRDNADRVAILDALAVSLVDVNYPALPLLTNIRLS
ncbi:hypothetical protein D3C80_1812640 [compost metagenome]